VPIHIDDLNESGGEGLDIDKHYMELKKENDTESTIYVTTADFDVINAETKQPIDKTRRDRFFPPNGITGDHIDFLRLRPRVGIIPAEKIHLTCRFSIANAKQDGMFNVVSTCSYGLTVDEDGQNTLLEVKKAEWERAEKDVAFEEKNWKLLDGLRITKPDSFDFTIETVGVFETHDLIIKACNIINRKLDEFVKSISAELDINELTNQNTISNCFDVILKDDDYTIGKVIEYMMFSRYYEGESTLSFCGYKKMHPHDPHSILRLAYTKKTETTVIQKNLELAAISAIDVFCKIRDIMKAKRGGKM
jgi:DNA-directed RNA polymerase subunit L